MTQSAPVRIGIAGMGAAGQAFVPALRRHAGFEWVAFAEPEAGIRQRMTQAHGVAAYASVAALLGHPGLDAVIVATPTPLHAEHSLAAAAAGLHAVVEKPMAVSLEQGLAMVEAAERAGVVLLVGHSHSFDAPMQAMRALIASGELGRVRMVNTWCFTDWVQRPRRADELDVGQGGGVTFRQGAHQFDIVRLLCGGRASSVRARTFDWQPQRQGLGAHAVFVDFADGAAATAVYNGYGGLSSMDFCFDISEWGLHQPSAERPRRQRAAGNGSGADEMRAKHARAGSVAPAEAPYQPFFGLTVASCELGDIRQSPSGLLVHSEGGRREIVLPVDRSPRDLVLAELHAAIDNRAAALHHGRWGLATLEVCIAAMASSQSGSEVRLQHQVALPTGA